jgi:hypothetical protein
MATVNFDDSDKVGIEPVGSLPFTPPATTPPPPNAGPGTNTGQPDPNRLYSDYSYYSSAFPQTRADIDNAYMNTLGRPRQPFDTQYFGMTSAQYYPLLQATPEAQNYAKSRATPTTTTGGGSLQTDWTKATQGLTANERDQVTLQKVADNLNALGYHASMMQTDPQGRNQGMTIDGQNYRVIDSSGNWVLVPDTNGSAWGDGGGGATGGGGQYTDASSQLYVNEILNRLRQLRSPVSDPLAPLYQLSALSRIRDLGNDPYTNADDAALVAKYRDPLTQARDAAKQQAAEQLARRNIGPSSGVFIDTMNKIDQGYERGIAAGANNLAVNAVTQRQRNLDEQLQIFSDLLNYGKSSRTENTAQADDLLRVASLLPGMDENRLKLLLEASGEGSGGSPSATTSALLGQGQQQLTQSLVNSKNAQDTSSTWGAVLNYYINHPEIFGGLFG